MAATQQIVAPERGQPLSQLVWSGEGWMKSPRPVNSDVGRRAFEMRLNMLVNEQTIKQMIKNALAEMDWHNCNTPVVT